MWGRMTMFAVSGGILHVTRQASGVVLGVAGQKGGGKVGRVLAYPVNQMGGRLIAAGIRGSNAAKELREHGARHFWARGERAPVLGKSLEAAAYGFVTNHTKAPAEKGTIHGVKQMVQGMKYRPIFHSLGHSLGHGSGRGIGKSGGSARKGK